MRLRYLLITMALASGAVAEDVAAVLQRQTQELVDAITYGKPEVWERYLDDKAESYVGHFTLSPEIAYDIRLKDGKLEGQRGGRAAESLMAEAPDVFFVPGSPRYRKIFKRDAAGRITGFVERREAWDLVWTRVD